MDANGVRTAFLLLRFLGVAACVMGQTKLPEIGPEVRSVFPAGGQAGATVEMVLRGRRLDEVSEVEFLDPGISAEICRADYYELVALITIDGKVRAGIHDYRLISQTGATVGAFHVTQLPSVREKEPNNQTGNAQKVKLPVVVDGVVDMNDSDVYAIQAEAGETLVFQILASRLGAGLDA